MSWNIPSKCLLSVIQVSCRTHETSLWTGKHFIITLVLSTASHIPLSKRECNNFCLGLGLFHQVGLIEINKCLRNTAKTAAVRRETNPSVFSNRRFSGVRRDVFLNGVSYRIYLFHRFHHPKGNISSWRLVFCEIVFKIDGCHSKVFCCQSKHLVWCPLPALITLSIGIDVVNFPPSPTMITWENSTTTLDHPLLGKEW